MTYKTVQALITDIETALYQSAGPMVQAYSQDVIIQMIQDAFDGLFIRKWWPQFRVRETLTLDGTTGHPTTPLVSIKQYDDIRYIFRENSTRPLSKLPLGANVLSSPFNNNSSSPQYIEADASNIFTVWPVSAVGRVSVVGRARPSALALTDTVKFDPTLIKHYAAWSYFSDDASNPAAAEKHRGLFEQRLSQIEEDSFNEPIQLDPWSNQVPDRWYER